MISNTCDACGAMDKTRPVCRDACAGRIKVNCCPYYAPMTLSQAMQAAIDRPPVDDEIDPIPFKSLRQYGCWRGAIWIPDEAIWPYFSGFRAPTRAYPSGYIRAAGTRKFSKWLFKNRPDIYTICRVGVYANPKYFSIGVNENATKTV